MSSSLSPPGMTEDVRASSALVLAPHYDDEVLGCGGLLCRLAASGAVVRVLFLSDGAERSGAGRLEGGADSSKDESKAAYRRRRRQEAKAAALVLGIAGIDHLDLPDGRLDQHLRSMGEGIRRALLSQRPNLLLVPSPLEASADHRATFRALHDLLGGVRRDDGLLPLAQELDVLAYEINHPLRPDVLVDVSEQTEILERAMACYVSQQEQHDYLGACLGLAKFRTLTLPPDVAAAEAFQRLTLEDFRTHAPSSLAAKLAGDSETLEITEGPKISVIVRTMDRPELLREALASLAASTYRRAEIILVNDGGKSPEMPAEFPLAIEVVNLESNRGRAAAANAGIAAATGDYVAFLDDDDLVEPEHLATLAGLVQASGVRVAYTDAAVGVYELDGDVGWRCSERRIPYSRDFDPELLLFDNYIPFHTLLIERQLLLEAGDLDEELPFFEDWDYLIRLAALTPFHHLAQVTCEYRQFRGGGHHILGDRPEKRADFLSMKARVIQKHADRRQSSSIAWAIDRLRAESVLENEEVNRLRAESVAQDRRYHRLNGKLAGLEVHRQVLEASERRAQEDLRQRDGELRELRTQIDRQSETQRQSYAEIERLNGVVEEHSQTQRETWGEIERLNGVIQEHTETLRQSFAESERLSGDVQRLEGELEERSDTLRQTWAEIERLNQLIRTMESTRAWRAHQWWQEKRAPKGHS